MSGQAACVLKSWLETNKIDAAPNCGNQWHLMFALNLLTNERQTHAKCAMIPCGAAMAQPSLDTPQGL